MVLSKSAQGVMDGEENEQMGAGEDRVCFDVEKEYVGEEDEVLWPHRPEERYGERTDAREDGREADNGQTSNDLVPGLLKNGPSWTLLEHHNWRPIGKDGEKLSKSQQLR